MCSANWGSVQKAAAFGVTHDDHESWRMALAPESKPRNKTEKQKGNKWWAFFFSANETSKIYASRLCCNNDGKKNNCFIYAKQSSVSAPDDRMSLIWSQRRRTAKWPLGHANLAELGLWLNLFASSKRYQWNNQLLYGQRISFRNRLSLRTGAPQGKDVQSLYVKHRLKNHK